jgi:transketolase
MREQKLNMDINYLKKCAQNLRVDIIEMLAIAGSGHPGGSLSIVEIVTSLYFLEMKHDPKNPKWQYRDRLVLSKGHACPAIYAAMAETGYFPKEELKTLRRTGSRLQGHPDPNRLLGLEAPTGSLGQGLSVAQGMALASKLDGNKYHTYCILGDGECQEGQVWEALMSAPKFKLGGLLTVILDYNKSQIDGFTKDVMDLEPLKDKLKAFNWEVLEINGHDFNEIISALRKSKDSKNFNKNPYIIIAHTIKGKGVSFMENKIEWHGMAPNKDQAKSAIEEILNKN